MKDSSDITEDTDIEKNIKYFKKTRASYEKLIGYIYGTVIAYSLVLSASSAPYLYVNDAKANCGARFLLEMAKEKIIISVSAMFVVAFLKIVSELFIKKASKIDRNLIGAIYIILAAGTALPFYKIFFDLIVYLGDPPLAPPGCPA